jgi:hypothetical protein
VPLARDSFGQFAVDGEHGLQVRSSGSLVRGRGAGGTASTSSIAFWSDERHI